MRKRSIMIISSILILLFTGYVISSSGGKIGRTESGCTCHGNLSEGNSSISVTSNPDIFTEGYIPESTYTLTISVTGGPVGNGGGFNLKASAGALTNPGSNAQIISGEATHSNANARSWTVDWIAPDNSVQSVVFNFAGNSVNSNGNTAGDDPTPLGQLTAQIVATKVTEKRFSPVNDFELYQNYPNPFNNSTQIKFRLGHAGVVTLKIFSIAGKEIFSQTRYFHAPGNYRMKWNGNSSEGLSVPSGIYLYRITVGGMSETKRLVLIK